MITELDAKKIAVDFIRESLQRELPFCTANFQQDPCAAPRRLGLQINSEADVCRPCWVISFETVLDDGQSMDGATLVTVDAQSGKARFFNELWAELRGM